MDFLKTLRFMRLRIGMRFGGMGLLLALWLIVGTGCESFFLGSSDSSKNIKGMNVTHDQLRMTLRALVNPMTGIIRTSADKIEAEAEEPKIKDAAIYWKSTAVPSVRETLYSPQPLIALLDTWALGYQMMDYFQNGQGKQELGPYAPIAYDAAKEIADRMEALYEQFATDDSTDEARGLITEWAKNNPIKGSVDSRESVYNKAAEIGLQLGLSFRDSVDAMVNNVDDLNRKLGVYSDQLPEQMRWEAQLFTREAYDQLQIETATNKIMPLLDSTQETMDQANVLLTETNGLVQDMPELVAKEREAIMAFWEKERAAIFVDIDKEMERAMDEVQQARIALTNDLRQERAELQGYITQERKAALDEVEAMRDRLVDDFFRKSIILLILIAVYVTLMVVGVLWYLNKRAKSKA